jgi:apolipoprotein N-acyltransferase
LIAWVCGVVWYLGTCYWIYPVMHGYGNLGVVAATLITILYCLIMGMHHGAFGLLVVMMARRAGTGNRRPLLAAPFFWVAIEFFRDRFTGVPWLPLGGAQTDNIPFARIAEATGVYGLSFAIMLVNCAFVAALLLQGRRRINLLVSAAAAAIALQMGVFAKPAALPANRQAVLLQPDIPVLNEGWTPQYFDNTIATLARLSADTAGNHPPGDPGLIIWPEAPAPFFVSEPKFQLWTSTLARETNSYLIIGSIGVAEGPDPRQPLLYNSALIVDPLGRNLGRYDKIHLVPFGEYVPFRRLLFFAKKLTREVGETARGTERKVFDLSGAKVSPVICYESVFPGEVREFVGNGAQVLVNISNDGWYGETGAPYQHLQMTRMRAIENHRWILLDTNNGVTSSIDPFGRVVKRVDRNIVTAMVAPYDTVTETTLYSRFGDVFAWICVIISLVMLLVRWRIGARTMIEAPTA